MADEEIGESHSVNPGAPLHALTAKIALAISLAPSVDATHPLLAESVEGGQSPRSTRPPTRSSRAAASTSPVLQSAMRVAFG